MKKNIFQSAVVLISLIFPLISISQEVSLDYKIMKNKEARVGHEVTYYRDAWGNCSENKHQLKILQEPQNGTLKVVREMVLLDGSRITKIDGENIVKPSYGRNPCPGKYFEASAFYYTPNPGYTGIDVFKVYWKSNTGGEGRTTRIIYIE